MLHMQALPDVQSLHGMDRVSASRSLKQTADWACKQPEAEAACLGDLADGETKDILPIHCNVVKGSQAGGMRLAERLGVISARKVTLQAAVWAAVRKSACSVLSGMLVLSAMHPEESRQLTTSVLSGIRPELELNLPRLRPHVRDSSQPAGPSHAVGQQMGSADQPQLAVVETIGCRACRVPNGIACVGS